LMHIQQQPAAAAARISFGSVLYMTCLGTSSGQACRCNHHNAQQQGRNLALQRPAFHKEV
jgi:hypothetical protein